MPMGERELNRRKFLLGCTAAVATAAVLPVVPAVHRYAIRTQLPEAAWRYLWNDNWRAVAEDLMPRHVRAQGWMP